MADRRIRLIGTILCEAFAFVTIIILISTKQYSRLSMAIGTVLLILLPAALEHLLKGRIHTWIYLYGLFYAIGPMLGHCWNLYYLIPWWDKLLHISGGVMFALLGIVIGDSIIGTGRLQKNITLCFALSFSIALSACWEFVEFGMDFFTGSDMQNDTVITAIHSYVLGSGMGVTGNIDNIRQVVIDGRILPVGGYLDIGLIDTMMDMILESLGALAAVILYALDRNRHPIFVKTESGKM